MNLTVSCDAKDDNVWKPYCLCISLGGSGSTPDYQGVSCYKTQNSTLSEMCCKATGYPASGTCSCYAKYGTVWSCMTMGSTQCTCEFRPSPFTTSPTNVCDSTPGANGKAWHSCANPKSNQCYCMEGSAACPAGYKSSSKCHSVPTGWQTPPTSCPYGDVQVSECSPGPDCKTDADCGGDCFGDDPVCCSGCSAGKCETCCYSSGSETCF